MKKIIAAGYYVFIALVLLIALLSVWSLVPIAGNIKLKIVKSGSMEPAIKVGSVVLIKPQANYTEGDIITFGPDNKKEVPTTNRVTGVRAEGGNLFYQTKGDANDSKDTQEVRGGEIIGKVAFSVPYLGYLLDFVKKPIGFMLIIGVPAAMVIGEEFVKIWAAVKEERVKKKSQNNEEA